MIPERKARLGRERASNRLELCHFLIKKKKKNEKRKEIF